MQERNERIRQEQIYNERLAKGEEERIAQLKRVNESREEERKLIEARNLKIEGRFVDEQKIKNQEPKILKDEEQRLKDEEQRLKVKEQRLKEKEQSLNEEEQRLKAEKELNQKLNEEEQRLKAEKELNQKLNEEEQRLKAEKELKQKLKEEEKIDLKEVRKLEDDLKKRRLNGTVKWFNDAKGYGFIKREDKEKDIFVHFSAVKNADLKHLNEGEQLTFEVEYSDKGPSAINLQKIDDEVSRSYLKVVK